MKYGETMQPSHTGLLQRITPQKKIQLLKAQLTQVENYQDKTDFEQQWKTQRIDELTKEIKDASISCMKN